MALKPLVIALCLVPLAAPAALAQARPTPGDRFLVTWDLDADGTATLAELEEMRGIVFGMFDADADGVLTAEEYVAFDETRDNDLPNHGNAQNRAVMARVSDGLALAVNDADGDGAVTLAEFIAGTGPWLADIDRDGDGGITSADFGR